MKNEEMKEMQFSNLLSFVQAKNKIKWRGEKWNSGRGKTEIGREDETTLFKEKSERLRGRES